MIVCRFEPNDDKELLSKLKSSSFAHVTGLGFRAFLVLGVEQLIPFCSCADLLYPSVSSFSGSPIKV